VSAVYVWIETYNGVGASASWEALGAGKVLAEALGVPLTAVVFGQNAANVANEAAAYGAANALIGDDATLNDYRLEAYAALLTKLVRENAPRIVLAASSARES